MRSTVTAACAGDSRDSEPHCLLAARVVLLLPVVAVVVEEPPAYR
jgi:hypothetical protein